VSETARITRCFGARVGLHVAGHGAAVEDAITVAIAQLRAVHVQLTRFEASELTLVNADPHAVVTASPLMRRFAAAVHEAGAMSGGLVDATRLDGVEGAGYDRSRVGAPALDPGALLAAAPRARPALPDPAAWWRRIEVDDDRATITRPAGVRLDSGGLAKGMAADLVATTFAPFGTFAVDCAGDLRIGGRTRTINVSHPFTGRPVHSFRVTDGAVATSGVTRRAWLRADGSLGHHLIDPGRDVPAWTGLLQATALAPTALEAEVRAKAALLAGPDAAAEHLPAGGVLVGESGKVSIVEPMAAAVA
jgi:thiamine biosynthesis lipoprotein